MTATPTWPALAEDHPLAWLHTELASTLSEHPPHNIWGITLSPNKDDFLTKIILQKFLRANKGDKELALKQLKETLEWRRQFFDGEGKVIGTWDGAKYQDLGYITTEKVKDGEDEKKVVVTWNIYGNVKDFAKTFGDVQEFLRWRVDLMERSVKLLDLASAKEPIPDYDPVKATIDPYKTIQVHDYLRVSFFRSPAEVKTASKKTIEIFQQYYPELLEKKFFVNVPLLMSWMYTTMRALVAKETFKKLLMLSYGADLSKSMGSTTIPAVYGGTGEPLKKDEDASKENLGGGDAANDDAVKGDLKDGTAEDHTDTLNTDNDNDKDKSDKQNATEAVPNPAASEEPTTSSTAATALPEAATPTKAVEEPSLASAHSPTSAPAAEATTDSSTAPAVTSVVSELVVGAEATPAVPTALTVLVPTSDAIVPTVIATAGEPEKIPSP
ncbi:CRAL-TRIO domain-containing protein [Morchella snyderi]|nr:CRAL-TRIO domain-containing protein [Morchella snyderi]